MIRRGKTKRKKLIIIISEKKKNCNHAKILHKRLIITILSKTLLYYRSLYNLNLMILIQQEFSRSVKACCQTDDIANNPPPSPTFRSLLLLTKSHWNSRFYHETSYTGADMEIMPGGGRSINGTYLHNNCIDNIRLLLETFIEIL